MSPKPFIIGSCMGSKHSLHTFIHRTLVYRLIAVGLILSLMIGLAVLLIERDRVSQDAINIVVDETTIFVNRYDHLLTDPDNIEPEKIHQAIMEFGSTRAHDKLGSFLCVAVYDSHEKIITELFDEKSDNLDELKKRLREMNIQMPADGYNQYSIFFVAGVPHLSITLPFINKDRKLIGFVHAFFVFSEETIESSRLRGLRAMITSILIVLLTTLTLYPVVLKLARQITQFSEKLLKANLDTLETLGSAIALRDSDTNAHNYRVSIYAARLGEEVGLPNSKMRTLIKGSFLHDVGKIGIPDKILLKPGRLSDTEFEIMKTHVELGRRIVQRSIWLNDSLEVILAHHEKLSGRGFPLGLAGDAIPVTARIFAIADVFDALTSKRPYKEAWSFEQAMETMDRESGSHFDPTLLAAFERIARPLYDRFGGKEELFQEELGEITKKYFNEDGAGLEY